MRGTVADVVLPARSNPTQYLMQQQQLREKDRQLKEAQALKDKEANVKAFNELYKIDPGKAWERFNDVVYDKVSGFRDWVAGEQYKGRDARDADFQREYYNKLDEVKKTSEKTLYMKDMLDSLTKAVKDDPYRDDQYYVRKFLDLTQDEKGNLKDPNDIDTAMLEAVQYDMGGYNASLAARDFVKNSPENLVSWIEQNNSRYGGVITSRESITSKLYQTETLPDGSSRVKTDPQTGLPIMNITDDVVNGWKQDEYHELWLQQQMALADVDAYSNPEQYKEVERNILEKHLSPYAYAQKQTMSASWAQPKVDKDYEGSGLTKASYDNTMLFKKAIQDYRDGDLSLLESNPKIGAVVREGNKDYLYSPEGLTRNDDGTVSGTVMKVIDHSNSETNGDLAVIYENMLFKKKPSQTELNSTPAYSPDEAAVQQKTVQPAPVKRDVKEEGIIDNVLSGKGVDILLTGYYDDKKIKSAEYGKDKKGKKNIKLTLEGGKVVELSATEASRDHIRKLLRAGNAKRPKGTTPTEPAKATTKTTTPTEGTAKPKEEMPYDINQE